MGYDTIKAGIAGLLNALGYFESSQAVDFKNASAQEYINRYILKCLSGENQEDTIIDRFYDKQEWQILIAFERSENNDITQYDAMHRAKDAIIKSLDKPANWASFAKVLKYDKCSITEMPNYYILDIRIYVLDLYIY
ncbi:MAG: hypothetical protein PHO03_06540 [Candidatus Omnitrophica bacterium]|nr:hypothetical protein [Candidatus Omnitrophota bacterium]